MGQPQIPTSEQLMAEMAWIRRLSRALVRDAATADDVAQDAWLVAAERKPAEDRPLRPWLARVVVNLVRTRRRGDARRGERDAAFDAGRDIPTPAELVERVELQRAVADEVLALAEPYRSTVLLHFVEGYSSAEIARQLGIPDGTVRRRLKTALEQLRQALKKRTDQPKRGWLAALAPLARSPGPTPIPAAMGVVAMKKVVGLVILIVLLLALGIGALWRHRTRSADIVASGGSPSGTSSLGSRQGAAGTPTGPSARAWFPQSSAPPRRIAGQVMSHGKPIGGAKVRLGLEVMAEPNPVLVMPDSLSNELEPIAEVTSAADGTFDFGVQPAAAFTVSASAAAYSPADVRISSIDPRSRADRLVLELGDCHSRLSGKIEDASGDGISGARISVAGLSGTTSDASGNYSVCLTPRDGFGTPSALVHIVADGYGSLLQTVIAVGDLHHDFVLVPEAVLVGRVTTSDGQPAAGAFVTARADPAPGPTPEHGGWAVTGGDGRFEIAGLAPGTFHLMAATQALRLASPVDAVARPATTSRELHLVLSLHVARVRGHLYLDGAPVGGVSVTASHAGGAMMTSSISQADGTFVLVDVPYGATHFYAAGYRVDAPAEVQITKPEVDDLRLDIAKMASVRGYVTRGGQPVAGADVRYMAPPQSNVIGPPSAAKTDAHGAFVLEGLPAGPGRLVAWDNAAEAFSEWQSVELSDGEDKTVDLQLDKSGEVKGTVVDEAGNAVPDVYVRMDITDGGDDMCESMTDSAGQFDCAMLSGGAYRPTVAPSPGARQGFAPATGDQLALIHVPRAGVVTGIQLAIKNERLAIQGVVIDDTGAPVPDVQIEAIGRGRSSMDFPFAMSDAGGHFAIANLARGTYQLRAHAADGSEAVVPDLAAGGDSTSITLARAGAIEGTLVGFAMTPRVTVGRSSAGMLDGQLAFVDGSSFSSAGLPPGHYIIEAEAGDQVDGQPVDVHPGETVHVTLQGRGTRQVGGTITEFAAHTPISGMRCDAELLMGGRVNVPPPDPSHQAFTDASGHFTVNAPLGPVRIFCFSPTGGPLSAAATEVDVTDKNIPTANVFSVRATFGNHPSHAGFTLDPFVSPLTVSQIVPTGPAAAAGLRVGDQLVTIDGASLQGVAADGAMLLLMNHRPGTTATLGIERGGGPQTIKMVVK